MSDYVDKLSLDHDPFVATARYRSFFAGAEREAVLQRLVEQAHYGAPISIVNGVLGSGRSTLSNEFQKSFSEEAFCIRIQATLFMNQGQFLDAVLEQLPIGASSPDAADIVEDLCKYAERLYLDAKTLILIVDDAHELASDVHKIIDKLTDSATEGAVHVLLLGEKQLANMLDNVLGERASGRVIEEELVPLSADEANAYVRLKLADAGFTGDLPLSAAEIGELCNEAEGVPGKFNIEFSRALNEKLQKLKTQTSRQSDSGSLLQLGAPYWATAAVLVVLMLILVLFTSPDSEAPEIAATDNQPASTRIELPLDVATSATSTVATATSAGADELPGVEAVPQVSDSVASLAPEPEQGLLADNGIDSEPHEIATGVPVDVANNEDRQDISVPNSLLAYPAENFTVQIMGSRSEENVQRFIAQQLAAFNAQYFETIHEGQAWFVVVMGNFVSREVASRAISDLPGSVRRLNPFIRSLAEVQATIRQYQGSNLAANEL